MTTVRDPYPHELDVNWYRVGYNLAAHQLHAAEVAMVSRSEASKTEKSRDQALKIKQTRKEARTTTLGLAQSAANTIAYIDGGWRWRRRRHAELRDFLVEIAEPSAVVLLAGALIEECLIEE